MDAGVPSVHRSGVRDVMAIGPAGDPSAGRLDEPGHQGAGGGGVLAVGGQGRAHPLREPQQPQRVQGRRHARGPQEALRQGVRVRGHLRRRLPAGLGLPPAHGPAAAARPRRRPGAGPLALRQRRRLHPHPHPGDVPQLPLRRGAGGGLRLPRLLRLQRHGRGVARRRAGGRRRVEGAHHRGGHGPGRARQPPRLALRLRRRPRRAQRAAQHLQGVPLPAAPVVVRPRQPVPQGAAGDPPQRPGVAGEEAAPPLRLLLRQEGGGAPRHFPLLLRRHPGMRAGAGRRATAQVRGHVRAGAHHAAQRRLHAKVLPPPHLLDPLRERHVHAPIQGRRHRTAGGQPRQRVGGHRQARQRQGCSGGREEEETAGAPEQVLQHEAGDACAGARHGGVPALLRRLRHCLLRPRPLLHVPAPAIGGGLYRWLRLRGSLGTLLMSLES